MTRHNVLISVIVAYHNEARYIADAARSVESHDYRPIELIMVDDGSTDGSRQALAEVEGADIQIVHQHHATAKGLSAARNTGLLSATGDYITYLDGDDMLAPGRLRKMLEILENDRTIDVLIGTDVLVVEPGAQVPAPVLAGRVDGRHTYIPSMLYSRRVHEVVGGFDTRFKLCEDVDWINRAAALDMRVETCEVLATKRRIHGSNMSYQTERIQRFRMRSLFELNSRRRRGMGHRVDPGVGVPVG